MKTLLIDNESDIRELLAGMLSDFCPQVEVIDQANGVLEGVEKITRHKPELVFLDVEMDDGTGFDLLQKLDYRNFHLIFVTAHDKYALRAFRFNALDYLLKPLNSKELITAVSRAAQMIEKSEKDARIDNLLAYIREPEAPKRIILKNSESIHYVLVDDIIWCKADGSYTRFFIKESKELLMSGHLKEYEQILPTTTFFRTHNSFLINLQHLTRFDKAEGGSVVMSDNSMLPVAVRKKEELLKRLNSI